MKAIKKYLIIIVIVAVLSVAGIAVYNNLPESTTSVAGSQTSVKAPSEGSTAKATATINKSFKFNAVNQNKAKKEINFTISTVDRKDEIRVKGESRKAPKGYDFLLVRVEIENSHSEKLAIAPSDLIRLEDGDGKLYAPDYHNGNVILEPLSVKKDLLSFIVNKDSKSFTYKIGELDKNKETVQVNF